MVKIRLAKYGNKNNVFYRIVVTDQRRKLSGKTLEVIGFWNPIKSEKKIDKRRLDYWVSKGAKVTPTLAKII